MGSRQLRAARRVRRAGARAVGPALGCPAFDHRASSDTAVRDPAGGPMMPAKKPIETDAGIPALHPDHLKALVEGRHPRPHEALGQHPATVGGVDGFVIRVVRPLATTVTAVQKDGTSIPLE